MGAGQSLSLCRRRMQPCASQVSRGTEGPLDRWTQSRSCLSRLGDPQGLEEAPRSSREGRTLRASWEPRRARARTPEPEPGKAASHAHVRRLRAAEIGRADCGGRGGRGPALLAQREPRSAAVGTRSGGASGQLRSRAIRQSSRGQKGRPSLAAAHPKEDRPHLGQDLSPTTRWCCRGEQNGRLEPGTHGRLSSVPKHESREAAQLLAPGVPDAPGASPVGRGAGPAAAAAGDPRPRAPAAALPRQWVRSQSWGVCRPEADAEEEELVSPGQAAPGSARVRP